MYCFRKAWSFLSDFILAGGLHAIADHMANDNLYIRGQALEIFLSTTDCGTNMLFENYSVVYNANIFRYIRLVSAP